jgi:ketosteroid isomerase-like protein
MAGPTTVTTDPGPGLSPAAVTEFLETYAAALASGDASAITACFAHPAMVLRDAGAAVALGREEITAAFAALARNGGHRSQPRGIPRLRRAEALSADLTCVDVVWHGVGPDGRATGGDERYVYVLRHRDGELLIHVAVGPLPAGG